jgi:hypothetical protein
MIDEECTMELKSFTSQGKEEKGLYHETSMVPPVQPMADVAEETELDRNVTLSTPLGVRYSQPGRFQT